MPDPHGDVYLVAAVRTPIGRLGGALAEIPCRRLGAVAIAAAVERSAVPPDAIDEVYMGQVLKSGAGQAPARQAALGAGLPESVPATTIDRVCGSGMKAIMIAAAAIKAGDAEVVVAGGMESMSQGPYLLPKARFGYRYGHGQLVDSTITDGLWCAIEDCHMGTHAERVALSERVSRADQDAHALESHRRAVAAADAGRFDAELVPVPVVDRKTGEERLVTADEGPRRDTSLEALARLRPAFDMPSDETTGATGTVTAGMRRASMTARPPRSSLERAPSSDTGSARSRGSWDTHRETWRRAGSSSPRSKACEGLEERTGIGTGDYDLVEINEAFAAQTLADGRALGLDWERVNVNGGAIALGHPIGASGARIVATLAHELRRREGRYGLATLCLGGGGSVAMAIERVA